MKTAEFTKFEVRARCPYCEEESLIYPDELRDQEAQCQHCDEMFGLKNEA
ncbi:hypothetical protein [Pseudoalteromonas sp. R3]|nr:hypothetical protein [Pseudoalteromonas sp. R3]